MKSNSEIYTRSISDAVGIWFGLIGSFCLIKLLVQGYTNWLGVISIAYLALNACFAAIDFSRATQTIIYGDELTLELVRTYVYPNYGSIMPRLFFVPAYFALSFAVPRVERHYVNKQARLGYRRINSR